MNALEHNLTYSINQSTHRCLLKDPYTLIAGDISIEMACRIFDQMLDNNNRDDISFMSFLRDGNRSLRLPSGMFEYLGDPCIEHKVDILRKIIESRISYAIEHNIYSLTEESRRRGYPIVPCLFVVFDDSVDLHFVKEVLQEAHRLMIFVFFLTDEDGVRSSDKKFLYNFSSFFLVKMDEAGNIAVNQVRFKITLDIRRY